VRIRRDLLVPGFAFLLVAVSGLGLLRGLPAAAGAVLLAAAVATGWVLARRRGGSPASPLASADSFRLLTEKAPDFISVLAPDGTVRYRSPSFQRFLGYPPGELVGRTTFDFIHPDDRPRVRSVFRDLVAEPGGIRTLELRFLLADGSWRTLDVVGTNLLLEPSVAGIVINSRDVTDRKETEAEQQRLQRDVEKAAVEWRQTFDAIESPVVVVEGGGTVTRLNGAGQALAGLAYDEIVGGDLRSLGPVEPWRTSAALADAVVASHASRHAQVRDPETGRTWEIAATHLAGSDLRDERVILVARDVSRTVELQESLRRSATMSAMGRLVAGVAHEVRNPLFAISANLDALEIQLGGDAPFGRTFAVLRREVDRLGALMHELLEYGRPRSLEIAGGSLSEVVAEAVRASSALARAEGVEVEDAVPRDLPLLALDRERMVQVFRNLIENAIQHSPRGGRVTVTGARGDDHGQAQVVSSVHDTGRGFREEDLARVFEPFFTRRSGGTGLGLSIVARIVEEHGGRVSAANRPEGGASLTVCLPLARAGAALEGTE